MFARSLTIRLKPNSVAEFTKLIDKEALPILRRQKGFQDELTLVVPDGSEVVAISLWDNKNHAEAYARDVYPGLLKTLGKVVEGTPQLRTYDVANSTIAAHVAV